MLWDRHIISVSALFNSLAELELAPLFTDKETNTLRKVFNSFQVVHLQCAAELGFELPKFGL